MPWVSVEQMREVDRIMVEELAVSMGWMMENAGRSAAVLARALMGGSAADRAVTVLAGRGGNGGGGLVAARHLAVAGAHVEIVLSAERHELRGVVAEQLAIAGRMGLTIHEPPRAPFGTPDLVIDALLGYSAIGAPSGRVAALARWTAGRRVLALDVPTGLDPGDGVPHEPGIRATATMTIALPKLALAGLAAAPRVGELLLADISVPATVHRQIGVAGRSPFAEGPLVRLRG